MMWATAAVLLLLIVVAVRALVVLGGAPDLHDDADEEG